MRLRCYQIGKSFIWLFILFHHVMHVLSMPRASSNPAPKASSSKPPPLFLWQQLQWMAWLQIPANSVDLNHVWLTPTETTTTIGSSHGILRFRDLFVSSQRTRCPNGSASHAAMIHDKNSRAASAEFSKLESRGRSHHNFIRRSQIEYSCKQEARLSIRANKHSSSQLLPWATTRKEPASIQTT